MKKLIVILHSLVICFQIFATNYYVDASMANSGDGLTWETAFKTINSAAWSGLQPGDVVWVKTGEYNEYVSIDTHGAQVVGITYNVSVNGNRVYFPSGVDLSEVSTDGSDYIYVYRSRKSNNGAFIITGKGINYVETGEDFLEENGAPDNEMKLSAAVGKPIIYRGYTPEENDEVVITGSGSGFYFQDADFNIFENFTLRNSSEGFNNQNGGKFNVIHNNKVESLLNSNGIQIGVSTATFPNLYNIISSNIIFDPQAEGIYIGAGGQGSENNYTDFTHIIDNEIYTSLGNKELENAIDLKEHNKGSVVEGNYIHDINLMTSGNGVIDVRPEHDHVLIYGNTIQNIFAEELYKPVFRTYAANDVEIFNNIIFNDAPDPNSELFAWICQAEGEASVDFYNNTIHNLARGFWMENTAGTYRMHNNICSAVQGEYLRQWDDQGILSVKNNLFTSEHGWNPENNASEEGTIISQDVYFTNSSQGDFTLLSQSLAVNAASTELFSPLDFLLLARDASPDIGAFEYGIAAGYYPLHQETISVVIYPNPATSFIYFQFHENQGAIMDIRLSDLNGKVLYTTNTSLNPGKVALPELKPGIYLLNIGNKSEKLVIK